MPGSGKSHRHGIAMAIGWWYLRRLIRKRGTAAIASFVAGEGLSFATRPRQRHPLRWLLLGGLVAGGGLWWWRRRQGGDDWGDWEPVTPGAPGPAEPAPDPLPPVDPLPVVDPVAT